MRYSAIAFDLDGTLIDSAPDLHAAANRMLADLDRPALTLPQVISFIGDGVPKLVERCLAATGGAEGGADALARFNAHYAAAPADLTRPWPGALQAMQALRAAGLPLGICTNKPEAPAWRILGLLGMDGLFASVVGGDTLTVRKPDPAPLLHCLDQLGADPARMLYVGDSETDAATAINTGLPFALYTRGYRKRPVADFETALAFDDWAEFVGLVMAAPAAEAAPAS